MKKSFCAFATLLALSSAHAQGNISGGFGFLGFYAEYEQQVASHVGVSLQAATLVPLLLPSLNIGVAAKYFEHPDLSGFFAVAAVQSFLGWNEPVLVGQLGGGYRWKIIPALALNFEADVNLALTAGARQLLGSGVPITPKLGLHIYF